MYTLTVTPLEEDGELDQAEVERFASMLDIAVAGASSDCELHAQLELVTVLP